MGIDPVGGFLPAAATPAANSNAGAAPCRSASDLGAAKMQSGPFRELQQNKKTPSRKIPPSTDELPQDAVEVHQNPEVKDRITIQYLAGQAVSGQDQTRGLHVPSS